MYKSLICMLNDGIHRTSEQGRLLILPCYHFHLYIILGIRVYFFISLHMLWFKPSHRDIFLVTYAYISNTFMLYYWISDISLHIYLLYLCSYFMPKINQIMISLLDYLSYTRI
jgi:hypothetical protein